MSKRYLASLVWALTVFNVQAADKADEHANHKTDMQEMAPADDSGTIYKYVCPMHPQIIRDHESTCPICGMDLVRQAFEQQSNKLQISGNQSMPSEMRQGFAIRTTRVQNTTIWKYIPTFGKVIADESKVIHIHPRAAGWISNLSVRNDGEAVKRGQLLYKIYAPEILAAQQDYLLAYKKSKMRNDNQTILDALESRLKFLGISSGTIQALQKRGRPYDEIPVYAAQDGVVANLTVQDGMYVQPQTELMSLQDLRSVWVEAQVLPLQQAWLANGLTANITTSALPDQRWEGDISYIYPIADAKTQATTVRIPLLNQDNKLKPNMLVDVEIFGGPKHGVLAIPLEAVIDDGQQKRVVKRLGNGEFEVVEVALGTQSKGVVEVLSGLDADQEIVTSGQFLIDSESQIQANLRRLISGE